MKKLVRKSRSPSKTHRGHKRSKLFIVSAEGSVTEPEYFKILNNLTSSARVRTLGTSSTKSSPEHLLNRIKNYLKYNTLEPNDEAWIVIDKDQWTIQQLSNLYRWSEKSSNYGLAVSNPNFEYWLLLHFEKGLKVKSIKSLHARLKRHLPNYHKHLDSRKFTKIMIEDAIQRARERDTPPCLDWPREIGCTTVYKFVERVINS